MDFYFVCPCGGEWDWRWPDGPGIPGSETAIVEITRRLARRGHSVTVYRQDAPKDMTDDGPIRWRDPRDGRTDTPGEWWICRAPRLIDAFEGEVPGRRLHLRCDDLHYGDELTPERAAKLNSVLCMSEWHRKYMLDKYPFLRTGQVIASGCGIASDRISAMHRVPRDPYRIMWGSSYDRGIEAALEVFRRARRHEPRLNFHATYGWNGYDLIEKQCGKQHPLVQMRDRVMSGDLTNVTFHGRLPRPEVWDLYASSSYQVYLTDFAETGAVSVREAQALGCIPIVTPYAALGEAVQGGILIDGPPITEAVIEHAVDALLNMIRQPAMADELRQKMIPHALKAFDWERAVSLHELRPPTIVFHDGNRRVEGPLRLSPR